KLSIAEQHIIPKTLKKHGLTSKELKVPAAAVRRIIQEYTREAGVRSLERNIASICRKVAALIVRGEVESLKLAPNAVPKYLGPPRVVRENEVKGPQVGIVTGLAWTETGGETLSIEVNIMPGKGNLQLTGQLGDVMKESAQAAFSYIRSHAERLGLSPTFQDAIDIHIHIPEGATPKDGPSAGAAMCCAMVSALSKKPTRGNLAMTGEITLRGRVLAIGGLKEKILAAVRAGIKTVIFPRTNEKDLQDLPDYVKDKVELVPVAHLDEVFAIVFKGAAKSPKPSGKARAVPSTRRSALGRVK
ncbi:MAG TPA: magnesium chelatase domain-containing protein, partial [Candidatus Obscuribacter sp.]|nr:magnesium chelatase domain-containing protein [Candidatus Obscuribacter sp.]